MPSQIEILVRANTDGAKKAFGSLTEQIAANRKKIGLGLTAIGAGITGMAALSIKSAQEEAIGINKLDQALKNVGTSYDSNKKSIEGVIGAIQNKTNFGDEVQREVLSKLVMVIGDEEKALAALPAVLDASAASGKDANSVAETMSKFLAGVTNTSDAVGLSMDKTASFTDRLGAVMDKVGGQAEATSDPFTQLSNRVGDLQQEFGHALLPILTIVADVLEVVTAKVIAFTDAHPTLTKWISIAVAALGGIALVVGPILLALPALTVAFGALGVAINLAMGPIGLIVLAVAGLTTGVILLWKNWDSVWQKIKQVTQTVVNFVIEWLNKLTFLWRKQTDMILLVVEKLIGLGSKLPFVGNKFKDAQKAIAGFRDKLDEGIPKIDITSDKVDDMGESFTKAEDKVSDATFGIEQAENSLVRTTDQMALDTASAWGSVEDAVLQAQGVTIQSLDEIEAAQKQHVEAVNASWERFMVNQDETVKKLNAANMSFGDVVEGLADRMDISTSEMAEQIAGFGIEFGDTMGLIEQFGRDSIGQVITSFALMTASAKNEAGNTQAAIQGVVRDAERQTLESVARQTAAINNMPRVPMIASGLHAAGGVGGSSRTTTVLPGSRGGASGIQGLKSTGGAGAPALAGFPAGTTFADIERSLGLSAGGVVKSPTLALIGERGPEAVVPLGKGGGMGSLNVTVNISEGAVVGVDDLQDTIAQTVRDVAEAGGFRGVF